MDVLRLSILILNEDSKLLSSMRNRLEAQGYLVACARNYTEALSCLANDQYDVVVTDVTMPQDDGLKLLKKVGTHIPFVVLSQNRDMLNHHDLDVLDCCFLEKSELNKRLAQAVWTAYKRFRITNQQQGNSEFAA